MEDVVFWLVPISLFVSVAVVMVLFLYFRYRARVEYQKTVRAAIERGQQLSPEFLERLDNQLAGGAHRDLRIGITSIALGISIALFGWLFGDDDMIRPLLAVGNIPFLVGLALVALWKFGPKEDRRT
jgi:hypothetical protein